MSTEDTNAARRGSGSNDPLGLVERLRQERRPTAWARGVDTDYPTAWEPNRLCHEAADEIERLRADLKAMEGFADLWYFVMDEAPREFEQIVSEWSSARWMDEAAKLRRLKRGA